MATTPNPLSGQDTTQQPQTIAGTPAPRVSPWKSILEGALFGLSGVSSAPREGRGGFGLGVGQGVSGAIAGEQRQFENQQAQTKLQFESAQAADSHVKALDEHRAANQLDANSKLAYKQNSASFQAFLQDQFGVAPDLSFNDTNEDATAGLSTLANANGGKIPPVATVQQPAPDGEHGQVAAYSPSQQKFQQNMQGYRKLIDTARAVQGSPSVDDATFNSMGFKGARDMASAAVDFMKPTPTFSLDKGKDDYLPNVLAQKQQQLQQYQEHKDPNGNKDADPGVVQQLQNGITYLQGAWDKTQKQEADQAASVTKAQEEAKQPFVEKEHKFQQGLTQQTAELNRKGVDQNTRGLKADEMITKEANDRDADLNSIQGIQKQLTMASGGNQQAYADAVTRFAEHEVKAGGINRFNETELKALGTNVGSWGRQLDAYASKGFSGKGAAPTIDEMGKILTLEADQRNGLYQSHVNNINSNILKVASSTSGAPIYAAAPGKPRLMSTDGGKTWQPATQ